MTWRKVSDLSQEELEKFFGPGARRDRMDLRPIKLSHQKKSKEFREQFEKELKASVEEQLPLITDRYAELPVLHVYDGDYMPLLLEARELYIMGYFYSCVVTCAVTAEKITRMLFRDQIYIARPPHTPTDAEMKYLHRLEAMQVIHFLRESNVLNAPTFKACQKLLEQRNVYAHGHGQPSQSEALKACKWLQEFLDGTVSVMPGAIYGV